MIPLLRHPFLFLRHGQTASNAAETICGATDLPLTAVGHRQAQEVALRILSLPPALRPASLWCSPLARARSTAEPLAEALSLQGSLAPLGVGIWLAVIMVCNLWFVLWPHQKRVLGFVRAPLDERLRCSRVTFLSARVNTMLSIPVLFFMGVGAHGVGLFS